MKEPKVSLLIDGYAMMFRSFYAIKYKPLYEGKPIGAVYGCASTILQAIERFQPDYLNIAFDAPQKTFRHILDPDYKAQRAKAPDEFVDQIPLVFDMIRSMGINIHLYPKFEADDIIGTLARKAEIITQAPDNSSVIKTYILSGDLDFLQLVSENTILAKFNGKEPLLFDSSRTQEKLQILPHQVIDYKAICGDSSDNYKGISGIGPKGAVKLLQKYETLENIYQHLEELMPKIKEKFEQDKKQAFHCQHLATIKTDMEVDFDFKKESEFILETEKWKSAFEKFKFNALLKRLSITNSNIVQEQDNSSQKEGHQMSLF